MSELKEVELVSTGVYLPGEPVPFDKIEEVIGHLDQAPPRIKKMIQKLKPMTKNLIGVQQCHFAIDRKTGKINESNTSMSVKAIRDALRKCSLIEKDIDLLVLANPVPDYLMPPTTTLIQEELGIKNCTEFEIHSNCTGVSKALEVAHNALMTGKNKVAAVVYSQLSSIYIKSDSYCQDKMGMENLLLRWFLADGAGAVILRSTETKPRISVTHVYNESVGGDRPMSMWLKLGAKNFNLPITFQEGLHHFSQDYRAVNEIVPEVVSQAFLELYKRAGIQERDVALKLATVPSIFQVERVKKVLKEKYSHNINNFYSNVDLKGYCGGASVLITLDEIIDKEILKSGQILSCITIESSKWMVGGFIIKRS
ncbi:MAG: hypothetical protein ACPL4K_01600 [Candidatus Margulisiibacteriota bacterium]